MKKNPTATAQEFIESSLRDADELATAAADLGDATFGELRSRVQGSIRAAQSQLKDAGDAIEKGATRAAEAVREEVRDAPLMAVTSAAVAMLALGFICGYSCAARRA